MKILFSLTKQSVSKFKARSKVLEYKSQIINDQKKRFKKLQIIDEAKFQNIINNIKKFDVVYPCIGENFSYLNNMRKKQNLELNLILNKEDKFSWQFSNKGYFNFKNNIPKILTNFNLQ